MGTWQIKHLWKSQVQTAASFNYCSARYTFRQWYLTRLQFVFMMKFEGKWPRQLLFREHAIAYWCKRDGTPPVTAHRHIWFPSSRTTNRPHWLFPAGYQTHIALLEFMSIILHDLQFWDSFTLRINTAAYKVEVDERDSSTRYAKSRYCQSPLFRLKRHEPS